MPYLCPTIHKKEQNNIKKECLHEGLYRQKNRNSNGKLA